MTFNTTGMTAACLLVSHKDGVPVIDLQEMKIRNILGWHKQTLGWFFFAQHAVRNIRSVYQWSTKESNPRVTLCDANGRINSEGQAEGCERKNKFRGSR